MSLKRQLRIERCEDRMLLCGDFMEFNPISIHTFDEPTQEVAVEQVENVQAESTGSLVVRFKEGVDPDTANLPENSEVAHMIQTLPIAKINLYGMSIEDGITAYEDSRLVEYAHANDTVHVQEVPNDPRLPDLYGMYNIEAIQAWDTIHDASNVVVGIIDTGGYSSGLADKARTLPRADHC